MKNTNPNEKNCIMPEMPYCPACKYGYIEQDLDDDTCTTWHCLYLLFNENK